MRTEIGKVKTEALCLSVVSKSRSAVAHSQSSGAKPAKAKAKGKAKSEKAAAAEPTKKSKAKKKILRCGLHKRPLQRGWLAMFLAEAKHVESQAVKWW